MVTRAVSEGRGIAGLMAYLMHDKVTADGRRAVTDERVAWVVPIGGSPTSDVDLCVRIMQGVSADAAILKQLSGASNRGRKLRKPYAHFMTSWPPGDTPSREEMLEVGRAQLQALGCSDRLAIALAHTDTDHAHFHLVVCKVHPETGMAASLNHSGLQLSRCAEQWEREHGGIVIENRVRRNEARDAFAAHVDRYMEDNYKPDPNAPLRDQAARYDELLKKARAEARELHPLPPMERKRSRDTYGQPVETTREEHRVWSNLYDAQRAEKLPEPEQRAQRAEASHLLRHGPAPRVGPEPDVSVPASPAHPFPSPSRSVRVGPEPDVSVPASPAHPCPVPVRSTAVQVLADLCAQAKIAVIAAGKALLQRVRERRSEAEPSDRLAERGTSQLPPPAPDSARRPDYLVPAQNPLQQAMLKNRDKVLKPNAGEGMGSDRPARQTGSPTPGRGRGRGRGH